MGIVFVLCTREAGDSIIMEQLKHGNGRITGPVEYGNGRITGTVELWSS